MSRVAGILAVVFVVLLAMGFAAANAGHVVTLDLGIVTFYRVPVTLVAFAGLFTGMVVMLATGIHSDLKVRRILRDRLSQEARQEQEWIDRDQRDLFSGEPVEPSARETAPAKRSTAEEEPADFRAEEHALPEEAHPRVPGTMSESESTAPTTPPPPDRPAVNPDPESSRG